MTRTEVFRFNDAHDRDRASDGVSRYGFYLRHRRQVMFADWDDETAVTTDPVQFTWGAWQIANGPIMSPPYVDWDAGRLRSVTCSASEYDGTLIVRAELAVPRPAQLRGIRGWDEWRGGRGRDDDGFYPPDEEELGHRPAMLTSTVLLINIPTDLLYAPKDAPGALSVRDAKASVKRLGVLLEDKLIPILEALDR